MRVVALAAVLMAAAVVAWPLRASAMSPRRRRTSPPTAGSTVGPKPGPAVLTVDDVASSMVLLALALRSGCGVVEAVERVALVSSVPVARDLRAVAAGLRWGLDERAAWEGGDPAWRRAGEAMRLAVRAGIPPSALLVQSASDLTAAESSRLDVEAARVGVRLVLPLGLAFLPAFCLTTVIPVVLALARQVLPG